MTAKAAHALIVEDEPDHGLLLRILLERDGMTVDEAADVEGAHALAARRRPDIVVLDVPAGPAGGASRCRRLRESAALADVPVVALSAVHDRGARDALFEAGVDSLLGKPVVPWLLEWQVRSALRRPVRHYPAGAQDLLAENRAWMGYLVHDLNNPLTVVGGSLSLMALDPMTPRQRRAMDQARTAHERLSRMVQSLLDVERVEHGRLKTDARPTSVAALLDEVAFALAALAEPREVHVDVRSCGETLWPLDRELVERALINLGENAIRHAPRGSTLRLQAREEGDLLLVSVADQGPGVPAEARERIFERSVQLGERRSQGAAGLGLAFCKLVAESHGGRAWVESGPRGGAVFVLGLPWPT